MSDDLKFGIALGIIVLLGAAVIVLNTIAALMRMGAI